MRAQLRQIGIPLDWAEHGSLKLDFQVPAEPLTSLTATQEEALSKFHKALTNNTDSQKAYENLKPFYPPSTLFCMQKSMSNSKTSGYSKSRKQTLLTLNSSQKPTRHA